MSFDSAIAEHLKRTAEPEERSSFRSGTVSHWVPDRGFGFVRPDGEDRDTFLHILEVERAGMHPPTKGDRLEFRIKTTKKGSVAFDIRAA